MSKIAFVAALTSILSFPAFAEDQTLEGTQANQQHAQIIRLARPLRLTVSIRLATSIMVRMVAFSC
jgi:hypothetical protein